MKNPQVRIGLSKVSFYLFCTFPVFIALHPKGVVAIVFLVLQLAVLFFKKPKQTSSGIWLPFLLSAPFLFYVVSLAYSSDWTTGYKYVERTMLLMILPWILYLNRATISELSLRKTLVYFSFIATGLTLYSLFSLVVHDTFRKAFEAVDAYYWIRTDLEEISGLHPTYFSLILALALFSVFYEIKKKTLRGKWLVLALLAAVVLVLGLLVASSKMILMCAFIGSIVIFGQGLSFKAILVRFGLLASALALLVLFVRPLRERVSTLFVAAAEAGVEENNPDSLRKGIYKSGFEAIGENIWFGTGIGDYQRALNSKYEKYGYEIPLKRSFNTHNQYLQIWLSVGIFPFILFVLSLLAQFLVAWVSRSSLHLAFVVMMSLSFLTENVLARQDGIFVYAFFSSMFCYASWARFKGRVFINGRFLSQPITGVQRYAAEMSKRLSSGSLEVSILTMNKAKPGQVKLSLPFVKGQLWEQLLLPIYLRLCGSPLLLNFGNAAPVYYSNQVITIHDVAFLVYPKWFSANFVKWYKYMIPRIVKRSRLVLTVSEFSKSEIVKHYKTDSAKIKVLHNGVPEYAAQQHDVKRVVEGEYILSVGSISERKNQKSLIEAYLQIENPKYKLVIAGRNNPDVFNDQKELLEKMDSDEKIIFVDSPSDDQVANLYTHALFTVYIPLYEGFGIPVLESLAYGKPVVLSDIPVFQELFKDVTVFSKLDNNDNLRGKLEEAYNSLNSLKAKVQNYDFQDAGYSYENSAKRLEDMLKRFT